MIDVHLNRICDAQLVPVFVGRYRFVQMREILRSCHRLCVCACRSRTDLARDLVADSEGMLY
jgi:hypothetical protein